MPALIPSSICVYVGLDLVGDGLMKLPFLRALRAAWPDARVTWLAGKGRTVFAHDLAPLAQGLIDEVVEDAGIGSHWLELLRRPLAGRRFDLVIDTQRRVLTSLIVKRIAHGVFVSGATLETRTPIDAPVVPPSAPRRIGSKCTTLRRYGPEPSGMRVTSALAMFSEITLARSR